ncbi:hypothetical protein HOY34_11245 [Xinfangfangia sp. D13-10-4-6]|uniref:hypothetical protein n=1 Tax=Pseudogemmobacter hezensis TaxID=2737662 RepID=UPI0015533D3C|nr:hypothetical protein [Pseudogemmobacter hezensis]NPD15777.1 hypothetical protein [Pseudogemmobacter hezensis]
MNKNRNQRRAMKRNAAANAAMLAHCCFDYDGNAMLPVTDPIAIAVLERAFNRIMQAGGEPMAVPLSEAEASAFPRHEGEKRVLLGGVTWLAVGVDVSGRAAYSMQCAKDKSRGLAHEAARALALSRLKASLDMPGGGPRGRRCRPMREAGSNAQRGPERARAPGGLRLWPIRGD